VLCLAFKTLFQEGGAHVGTLFSRADTRLVLLGTADHAVYAVTKGWASLISYLVC
jgi:hypothetical protein